VKLAYWSPLSPQPTGIADYSEELLPHLARGAEIHLFTERDPPANPLIRGQFAWHRADAWDEVNARQAFDLNLYQLGNNACHGYVLNAALRRPGVVVLHDLVLQHLYLGLSVERGNVGLYLSEMKRAYGERGAALGRQIAAALGSDLLASKFPLSERVVERSYGVLVLTGIMERSLRRRFGGGARRLRIARAHHHYAPPPPGRVDLSGAAARSAVGLPPEAFLVAVFGLVSPAKRVGSVIRGFREFSGRHRNALLLLVGEVQPGFPLDALLTDLALKDKVLVTGRVPLEEFYLYLRAVDVVVNLRFPSTGEISGALLRALGMGKPVLVSNIEPFVELPEWVAARIDCGPAEVAEIAATLDLLASSPETREAMGRFALEHVSERHRLETEAEAYLAFCAETVEALRRGEISLPSARDGASLAASVLATLSDLRIQGSLGAQPILEALRSATEPD
jgi:glycosyltransferase involved in cell wall biosynthesis